MGRKRDRDGDDEGGGGGGGDEGGGSERKRERGGGGGERGGGGGSHDGGAPASRPRRPELSVGERTSHIKNKQRRGEIYDRLRHKAAVRSALRRAAACAHTPSLRVCGLSVPHRAALRVHAREACCAARARRSCAAAWPRPSRLHARVSRPC
jgi:hypothetical protein